MVQTKYRFVRQWGALLIALLLLAGAVIHSLNKSHQDIRSGEEQRLMAQVRVINVNLSSQLQGTDRILRIIRDDLVKAPADRWVRVMSERRLEVLAAAMPGVRTLLAVDAHGIIRLSNWKQLLGNDVSQREYFQTALHTPDRSLLIVSPPFRTMLGAWGMSLVRTIYTTKGAFAGITVATLDPEYFKTVLDSVNYTPDMWSAIAHGDGVQFLIVPERDGQQGKNIAKPGSMFTRHMAGGARESVMSGVIFATGEHRLMAQLTIQNRALRMNKPLVVAASRDMSAIFADWRSHAWNQVIAFIAIMLGAMTTLAGFQLYQRTQIRESALAQKAVRDTQQQLKEIIEFLPDATFVIDRDKKVVIWNRAMEKISGVTKEEMVGKGDNEYTIPFYGSRRNNLLDLFDVDDAELKAKYSNIRRNGEILDAETFCPALNGGEGSYVWATGVPLYNTSGQRTGAIESIRDISERKKSEEYLRKLTHGIEHSASAVLITDNQGTIEYVNRKFSQLTGYLPEEAIGKNPRILKSDATHRDVYDDLWRTILSGKEWRGELLNRRKSGEVYWSIASISPLYNDDGMITSFIANVEDINERKNAEATIERLAYYDPLTDLPNRRMMQNRLELALKRSRRQEIGGALLYIDLDGFKHINDTLGHPAGDKLLREMAGRFTNILRDDDIVCRMGGDEFAVILHDIHHAEDAVPVARKLLEAISEPLLLEGSKAVVTGSAGIALFPKDGVDGKTLEKHADIALYRAKDGGKNTFRFFSEELNNTSS
ncbi:MAG: diguanylate cyclase [Desulfuromonadaceae bacterium]|nr:diguanylate cyclase [Desulfuromonadaceae bacterium]MDD2850156.1 diguanylate cyclase [Desulfuromonadaceae bacterium]MDD4130994.1 diguanylate cyclase [Desulfuromonadaceae bacterium]